LVVGEDAGQEPASPDQVAEALAGALAAEPAGPDLDPLGAEPPQAAAPTEDAAPGVVELDAAGPGQAELVLTTADGPIKALVTAPLGADEFSVAGVVWDRGTPPGRVLARAYQEGGWTEWYDLEADGGPDPGSLEASRAKGASGPLIAAGASGLQIEVLSAVGEELPEGLAPAVAPLANLDLPTGADASETAQAAAPWAVAQPAIKARAAWGASPADYSGNNPKGEPVIAPSLKGAIVHHQAGSNTYSQDQVPGIIKGIQNWHMGNNGWDDIGYNFLVDKYGTLWEGRQGGVTRNVVGAHAAPFNSGSTGLCFLGDLDKTEPTEAALSAGATLVAWRLSLAGITDLEGTAVYSGDPALRPRAIVSGHRDVNPTTCPGRYLYAKLDVLRRGVPTLPPPPVSAKVFTAASPDLTGDGRGDVLAIDEAGALFVYPMVSNSALGAPLKAGNGWQGYYVLAPGDWDGDGRSDIMSVGPTGLLYYYEGHGASFGTRRQIGNGWSDYIIRPSGDIDGDGNADLLAIDKTTDKLYLYRGNGRGGWAGGRTQVGNGWGGLQLHAAGRVNADKMSDIFAVDQSGKLSTYLARAGGGFYKPILSGNGWNSCDLFAGADLGGDGRADLLGQCGSSLYVYHGQGNASFAKKVELSAAW
jgi:hypothetical protein